MNHGMEERELCNYERVAPLWLDKLPVLAFIQIEASPATIQVPDYSEQSPSRMTARAECN